MKMVAKAVNDVTNGLSRLQNGYIRRSLTGLFRIRRCNVLGHLPLIINRSSILVDLHLDKACPILKSEIREPTNIQRAVVRSSHTGTTTVRAENYTSLLTVTR